MKRFLTLLTLILASQIANAGLFDGSQGEGTEISPYLIYIKADLEELADSVNTKPNTWSIGKYFNLMNDINDPVNTVIGGRLSFVDHYFQGNFDGQYYTINLAITTTIPMAGLFGFVSNAVIKNVITRGYINGNAFIGGIVGEAFENTTITNCINLANLYAAGSYIGGILANARYNVTVTNCINLGNVSVSNSYSSFIGGIVGMSWSPLSQSITIMNCINAGVVKAPAIYTNNPSSIIQVGGILGYNLYDGAKIINCINVNVVEGPDELTSAIGGGSNVVNCHYDKQFCNHKGVNGVDIIGQAEGHLTRNMVGRKLASLLGDNDWTYVEGATIYQSLYPQLKVLDHTNASKVGASPIFLYDGIKD